MVYNKLQTMRDNINAIRCAFQIGVEKRAPDPIEGFAEIERDFNGYFDVAASNVPFGDLAVADPAYAVNKEIAYRQATKSIHNYFFLKTLDQVREGFVSLISWSGCDFNRYSALDIFEMKVFFIPKVAYYQSQHGNKK